MEGLVRRARSSRDPNQVNIYVPPNFSLQIPVSGETDNRTVDESDAQSETYNASSSTALVTNSSTQSASLPVEISKTQFIPFSSIPVGPMSILGAGRVDPFANYPIQMNREEKWLIDQSKSPNGRLIVQDEHHNETY